MKKKKKRRENQREACQLNQVHESSRVAPIKSRQSVETVTNLSPLLEITSYRSDPAARGLMTRILHGSIFLYRSGKPLSTLFERSHEQINVYLYFVILRTKKENLSNNKAYYYYYCFAYFNNELIALKMHPYSYYFSIFIIIFFKLEIISLFNNEKLISRCEQSQLFSFLNSLEIYSRSDI